MVAAEAGSLQRYLAGFDLTISVMQDALSLERIAYELAEDAAAEGVHYLEVRYSPVLNTRKGLSLDEAIEASLAGLARAQTRLDVCARLIVCALRQLQPSVSRRLATLAATYGDRGIVGFDLAGPELGHPARDHQDAFAIAAEAGLGVTVHAGEADGPESIRQALDHCRVQRLGHGTRLFEDPELLARVRSEGIALEVCIASNVHTGAVPRVDRHPVRRYVDAELEVTLNTDNRLISGVTLTDEFWTAHRHLGFTWDELRSVARAAFAHAFLPETERARMVDAFDRESRRQR